MADRCDSRHKYSLQDINSSALQHTKSARHGQTLLPCKTSKPMNCSAVSFSVAGGYKMAEKRSSSKFQRK